MPVNRKRGSISRTLAVLLALFMSPALAPAHPASSMASSNGGGTNQDRAQEYALKAAFLEKFQLYVEWPKEAFEASDSPFVIAIYGKDPFGKSIDKVFKGKKHGEHPVELRRIKAPEEVLGCHMIFVVEKEKAALPSITKALGKTSTLLLGESDEFASKGGVVNFYSESKKIRFEINQAASKRIGLKISSALLKLARIVKEKG